MVVKSGNDPEAFRLSSECSNQLSYLTVVGTEGIEPSIQVDYFVYSEATTIRLSSRNWCGNPDSNRGIDFGRVAFYP